MPRYLVSGEVQGVGFRYFVYRQAKSLGLRGWVRNLPDGRVEVVVRGDSTALPALEAALKQGPSRAVVSHVDKSEISDEVCGVSDFQIR